MVLVRLASATVILVLQLDHGQDPALRALRAYEKQLPGLPSSTRGYYRSTGK